MATIGRDIPAAAYRPDVDGLRAIAVAAVLLFHAFPKLAPGGFVGVDIFFVISGFLITGNINRGIESGSFSIGSFYLRRVRRILPALLIVLVCCLIAGSVYFTPAEFMQLGKHTAGAALFASNFFYWAESGYFDSAAITKPLLHLWSLGIEEQFYLLWPLLILLSARKGKNRAFVLAVMTVSLGACLWTTAPFSSGAFYSPVTRMWELALGGFLAFECAKEKPSRLADLSSFGGVALIAVSVWAFGDASPYPGWRALLPTVGTGLVIAAGRSALLNRYLLSNPSIVFVGLISYPLYLWHWPLLSFAHTIELGRVSAQLKIGLLATSFVLATGTYLFLEQPLHRVRLNWRLGGGLVAIMACIGVVGAATYERGGKEWGAHSTVEMAKLPTSAPTSGKGSAAPLPEPTPAPVQNDPEPDPPAKPGGAEQEEPAPYAAKAGSPKSELTAAKAKPSPIKLFRERVAEATRLTHNPMAYFQEMGDSRARAVRHGICEPGNMETEDGGLKDTSSCAAFVPGATNILVVGDSIAGDAYAYLHAAYPEYNIIQKTGTGCNLSRDVNPKACEAVLKDALEIALSQTAKVDAVVLASLWSASYAAAGPLWFDKLLAQGVKVILMGPPVGFTIPATELVDRCPSSSKDGLTLEELTQCAREHSTVYREINAAMKVYAQQKGMSYVDLHELACNDQECPILDDNGQEIFIDTWHRSLPGDMVVARRIREHHVLERILGKP